MANNGVSFRQRAVIEFPVKEEIPTADIDHRLQRVYGDVCMRTGSVRRWVKHFKDGNTTSKISLVAVTLEQPQLNPTRTQVMKTLRKTDV
jgi:hypothetical protein